MAPIIRARGLRHSYHPGRPDEVEALRGIDLDIAAGEFVAVVGPNGSGKSTLAKHMNALLLPTAGEVLVAGLDTRDPALLWKVRQVCGMVFQNPDNQLVATLVEDDVAFGPENLGLPREQIRARVDEALARVAMDGFAGRAPHQLSGGQKQRVAIAGVLAMRPRVLVLDEATAMLDPQGRREVLATARDLCRRDGVTVVLITHFMEEAATADRVVALDGGRVVLDGSPREVFRQAERLAAVGLELPPVTRLGAALRRAGLPLPDPVLSVDELVEELAAGLAPGGRGAR